MSSTIGISGFTIYLSIITTGPDTGKIGYNADNSTTWTTVTSWPLTLTTSATPTLATPLVVTLTTDLTINSTNGGTNGFFIIDKNYTTIEGNYSGINHKVTIDTITNYPGLIQNGTSASGIAGYGKNNVTIQNLGVEVNTTGTVSTLADSGGWIGQQYFGKTASNNVANNCYSTGEISGSGSGGIFGGSAGTNSGNASATNCYSTGEISGQNSGGIFGDGTGSSSGNASAINCYSTGGISGEESGGIFGYYAGYSSGNASANNCYSTGEISGDYSGGIFGYGAGSNSGNASATNFYSTGGISGNYSGGIFGYQASYSGNASATNCYSTGVISGESSGGIFGYQAGYRGNVSATNCYSTGVISGYYSGGIFGSDAGQNSGNASANNCYSTGGISGYYSGGIFGYYAGSNSGNAIATNCYSTGGISGYYSGGIFGSTAGSFLGNASANNCYSTGAISSTHSGGIFGDSAGSSSGNVFATNCYSSGVISSGADGIGFPSIRATTYNLLNVYVANGSWSDTLAQGILLGFPATALNVASVWTSLATNTPYLLTAFNDSNYATPFVYDSTLTTGNYTTSAGIFTTGYTYQLFGMTGTPGTCSIATDSTLTFSGITTTGNEQYDAKVISYKEANGIKFSYHISDFYINPSVPTISSFNPTTGNVNGGTTVVIQGTNFIDVAHVQFDTTDATQFWINSPTQITAISPSHSAGTVNIKVITSSAPPTTITSTGQFTYSASVNQVPLTIISLNGTNGTGLTLASVGGSGTIAVTYAIIPGGSASGASITSGVLSVTSTGTVFVQATNPGSTLYGITYSTVTSPVTTITFRNDQIVPLAITPTSGTSPLTLSNPSPGTQLTVQNASYYSIYPFGTTALGTSMTSFGTLSSTANGILSATSSGDVIVYATNSGNATYNSQRTSATITLNVNSISSIPPIYLLPPVPIILIQPESQTVELGQDIQLFVVAEDGYTLTDKNIAKYQWYKNTVPYTPVDVPIPDSNSPILILENITADDEGDYYVVITNKLGGITISHIAQITVVEPKVLSEELSILEILDNLDN